MADLEQFYKKPNPLTKTTWDFEINTEKPNIVIVDKTNEQTVDRKQIMERINKSKIEKKQGLFTDNVKY